MGRLFRGSESMVGGSERRGKMCKYEENVSYDCMEME
jgi:hypothetical protein